MNDKKLQVINDGRLASLAENQISGLISEWKSKKMRMLTTAFRQGMIDHPTMMAYLGGIAALEDMEIEMRKRIERGENAASDLQKGELENG